MQLYKIDERMRALMERMDEYIDEETGEVDPTFTGELEGLGMEAQWKIEGIGILCKELSIYIEAVTEERKQLQAQRDSYEAKRKWLITYVTDVMKSMDIGKHISPRGIFTVGLRKGVDRIEVEYADNLPNKYIRVLPVEPMLSVLKEDLKAKKVPKKIIEEAGIRIIPGQQRTMYYQRSKKQEESEEGNNE